MFDAINSRRQGTGLGTLEFNSVLAGSAGIRSQDMASRNYFSHTTPDGDNFVSLVIASGIDSGVVGEILGRTNGPDSQSVALVVNAFMESPGHRSHIVTARYASMGVSMAVGEGNMKYYTVLFWGP